MYKIKNIFKLLFNFSMIQKYYYRFYGNVNNYVLIIMYLI